MAAFTLDTKNWAHEQFGNCQLGDQRRTKRLIEVAQQVANHPSGSFPEQMEAWSDLKAAYRLFDAEKVTFDAVATPHWQQTRQSATGRYLLIGDTTELDFGKHREIPDLGPTGNGSGYGFLLHSALMVDAASEEIVGLAGQTIHYRKPAPKKERRTARLKRDRESKVWGDVIDAIGTPPAGVKWVHVLDRGGDNFEVYCHLREQRCDWVVRAAHQHRKIVTPDRKCQPLSEYLASLPVAGTYELRLRARKDQPARTARLEVRFGSLSMPVPTHKSPYVKQLSPAPIAMWAVWVREVGAPAGATPIEWILYTSLTVDSFPSAWEVIGYYERRWLIEEWHKALKTGCDVTGRQLKTKGRLEAMVGLMSVTAVRLLQLKSVARTDPDRPAKQVVPALWLTMLKAARKNLRQVATMTVGQFYRELAKLGGFLGRKGDGEPGWITIWRGWEKLHLLVRGAELAAAEKEKCG